MKKTRDSMLYIILMIFSSLIGNFFLLFKVVLSYVFSSCCHIFTFSLLFVHILWVFTCFEWFPINDFMCVHMFFFCILKRMLKLNNITFQRKPRGFERQPKLERHKNTAVVVPSWILHLDVVKNLSAFLSVPASLKRQDMLWN